MIDRKTLKTDAREAIRQARPHPVWITLAVSAILALLVFLTMQLNGNLSSYRALFETLFRDGAPGQATWEQISSALSASGREPGLFATVLVVALELMTTVVSVGYTLYCLRVSRRAEADFWTVFDAFGIFLRAVVIRILKSVVLFLWAALFAMVLSVLLSVVLTASMLQTGGAEDVLASLLGNPLFIAGITVPVYVMLWIVSYFYRLADYFMLDHPELSCAQCLSMSRLAMRGRKKQLFLLDLSFLGWYLLSVVPFVSLWVQPYTAVTYAGFYREAAPLFWSDLEQKLRERAAPPSAPDHGYHVPGRGDGDGGSPE